MSVTRVEELLGPTGHAPDEYLVGFDRALLEEHRAWNEPHHYDRAADRFITSVHSWLIRTDRHAILVDACAGNHKERPWTPRFHRLETPFLERLPVAPEAIDFVLCTHLHADHVGWNTRLANGRWIPTFPNARYLFSKAEDEHARGSEIYVDSVLPVVEAGQALRLEGTHAIDDRLLVEPAPGHTPGHVILKLADRGARALFCGDVLHHPLQVYAPDTNSRFCESPELARATRKRVLEHCVESGARLFPTHFGAPHVAEVRDRFALRFVAPLA